MVVVRGAAAAARKGVAGLRGRGAAAFSG